METSIFFFFFIDDNYYIYMYILLIIINILIVIKLIPRTCMRVYARVLVPPNLYIHTYINVCGCVCYNNPLSQPSFIVENMSQYFRPVTPWYINKLLTISRIKAL